MDTRELFRLASGESTTPIYVGQLAERAIDALGASTRAIWLSKSTADKQFSRHRDLDIIHYEGIPYLLKHGEFYKDKNNCVVCLLDCQKSIGYYLKASFKSARCGSEIYLTSFHKIRESDVNRIKKRCTPVPNNTKRAPLI